MVKRIVVVVLAAVLVALAGSASFAWDGRRTVTVFPAQPIVGQTYQVGGTGWTAGRQVIVAAYYPDGITVLETTTVGGAGNFGVTMDARLAGDIPHSIFEEDPNGNFKLKKRITVTMVG